MEDLQKILKSFSELRDNYPEIETAIEMVCVTTGVDQEEVVGLLNSVGLYVLPGSEEEQEINRYITSIDKSKLTEKELGKQVGFYFCMLDKEAERLVHKWFNSNKEKV